jgi:HEAT repeat protein
LIRSKSELDGTGRLRALYALPEERASVPALLAAVEDISLDVCRVALRRLVPLAGPAERDALRGRLLELDIGIVGDVAAALRELHDQDASLVAAEGLRSSSTARRQKAALALRELHDPSSATVLLGALADSHVPVRRLAIEGLAELPPTPKMVSAFRKALADVDDSVRAAAVHATARRDPEAAATLQPLADDRAASVRDAAASVSCALACETIERLLEDQTEKVRVTALSALVECPKQVPLTELLRCLTAESWHVRRAAGDVVGAAGGPQAERALIARLLDQRLDVRGRALVALERCCGERLTAVLESALPDAKSRLRRTLIVILGQRGRGTVALGYLDDPAPEVRVAAAHALAASEYAEAATELQRLRRNDHDATVRNAAAVALDELKSR